MLTARCRHYRRMKKGIVVKGKSYLSTSFNYFCIRIIVVIILVQMVLLSLIYFDRINYKSVIGSCHFFYDPTSMGYLYLYIFEHMMQSTSCRLNIKCQMQATLMTNKANIFIAKKKFFSLTHNVVDHTFC